MKTETSISRSGADGKVRRASFGGLFNRRERWGLTGYGWLLLILLVAAAGTTWLFGVYPFFAITQPVEARYLAVEGWVHDYAIRLAINESRRGNYERVFTTGGPVQGIGSYINDYSTAASIGAGKLRAAGLAPELLQMVPSRIRDRDRTYSAARALREWCNENHVPVTAINVLTEDVHARRTRLLFQKAFGPEVKVGVIATPNPDYDARRWWRYSEGVRSVLGECIAYVYARVFFSPDSPAETKTSR